MWIQRSDSNDIWIFFLFLLIFIGMRQLYRYDNAEARYFIRYLDFGSYLRIYGNERDISFQRPFLLGLYLFSIVVLSMFCCIMIACYKESAYSVQLFFTIFGLLLGLTFLRYVWARFLGWLFDIQVLIRWVLFRTLAYYASLALILYALSILFVFGPFDQTTQLLQLGVMVFLIPNFFIQASTYYLAIKRSPKHAFYLFLYICISKIVPWIWVYLIFTKPLF